MKSNSEQSSRDKNRAKKAYQQPQLQVYGDLRGITQSIMAGKAKDGGMNVGMDMTT
jgi:hypothetical protein